MSKTMIEWICIGTCLSLIIALGIGVKVTISEKNAKLDTLSKELEEMKQQADNNRLAYDLVVENNKANETVEEVVNECKEKVEEAAAPGQPDSGWYAERLPDGVRDVFIECVCAVDDPGDAALRNTACAGEAGNK